MWLTCIFSPENDNLSLICCTAKGVSLLWSRACKSFIVLDFLKRSDFQSSLFHFNNFRHLWSLTVILTIRECGLLWGSHGPFAGNTFSAEVPPYWIFELNLPETLATLFSITQCPSQSRHACKSNMATLGDEDKSSSASSESRSSSWYYVQVILSSKIISITLPRKRQDAKIGCVLKKRR